MKNRKKDWPSLIDHISILGIGVGIELSTKANAGEGVAFNQRFYGVSVK